MYKFLKNVQSSVQKILKSIRMDSEEIMLVDIIMYHVSNTYTCTNIKIKLKYVA